MSIKISARVWEYGPPVRNQRYVLLAIADNANDEGFAFPLVETIAKKSLFTPRNALRVIKTLVAGEWMSVEASPKNHKANGYQINLQKLSGENLSHDKSGTPQVTNSTFSGDKSSIPILINRHEPSLEPSTPAAANPKPKTARSSSAKNAVPPYAPPAWIDSEIWAAYLEVREHKRAVMTLKAFKGIVRRLDEFRARGHDPNAILATSARSSWIDVYAPKPGDSDEKGNYPQQFRPVATVREEENLAALQRSLLRDLRCAEAGEDQAVGYTLGDGAERGDE